MNIAQKLAVTISSVACLLTTMKAAPAWAASFDFSYSGSSVLDPTDTIAAGGVLTADPYDSATNSYLITGITGTRNGVQIDSLLSPNTFLDNNNLFYPESRSANEYGFTQLDENGFAYTTGSQSYSVFFSYAYLELNTSSPNYTPPYGGYQITSFSVTPVTPVPEPSLMLGIIGISVLTGGTLLKQFYHKPI